MPIYEYRCKECDTQYEELVPLNAPAPPCPRCGSQSTEKQMSLFGGMGGSQSGGGGGCGSSGFS